MNCHHGKNIGEENLGDCAANRKRTASPECHKLGEHVWMSGKSYKDIPGTYVFDAAHSCQGYELNMFMMSLIKSENRAAFKADEAGYLTQFSLTDAQTDAVLKRDWNGMLEEGGNVYYTLKLAATDGTPYEAAYAAMAGMERSKLRAMMISGGRPPEGNQYLSDWKDGKP